MSAGSDLLDRVAAHIDRFIVFRSQSQLTTCALWVVHTHCIEAAHATPYLSVTSPLPQCGKSTLFEVLWQIVARPLGASNATAPAIYRMVDKEEPTLLLDEIDAQLKDDPEKASAIRSVLNAGYRRGPIGEVIRCGGPNHTQVFRFKTFCPKAFAGTGENVLHRTTQDRCIPIRLERKASDEAVERFKSRRVAPEAEQLQAAIGEWAEAQMDVLMSADPELPELLSDRAQEVWEPLLAIADEAGGSWPDRARDAALELSAGVEVEDDEIPLLLLTHLRDVFDEWGTPGISSEGACNSLKEIEEAPWGMWGSRRREPGLNPTDLARQLKAFDIKPRTISLGEGPRRITKKGYKREWFERAWELYLPPQESPSEASTASQTPADTTASKVTDQRGDVTGEEELGA